MLLFGLLDTDMCPFGFNLLSNFQISEMGLCDGFVAFFLNLRNLSDNMLRGDKEIVLSNSLHLILLLLCLLRNVLYLVLIMALQIC